MDLPREFQNRYQEILGYKNAAFLEACQSRARKSIRINTLKISVEDCLKKLEKYNWKIEKIPFVKNGFWVDAEAEERLGRTLEHFMGYYYIQEAASMIPAIILD